MGKSKVSAYDWACNIFDIAYPVSFSCVLLYQIYCIQDGDPSEFRSPTVALHFHFLIHFLGYVDTTRGGSRPPHKPVEINKDPTFAPPTFIYLINYLSITLVSSLAFPFMAKKNNIFQIWLMGYCAALRPVKTLLCSQRDNCKAG